MTRNFFVDCSAGNFGGISRTSVFAQGWGSTGVSAARARAEDGRTNRFRFFKKEANREGRTRYLNDRLEPVSERVGVFHERGDRAGRQDGIDGHFGSFWQERFFF